MAKTETMSVKLLKITVKSGGTFYGPGDTVKVSKVLGERLIASGEAEAAATTSKATTTAPAATSDPAATGATSESQG